jgi:SNF2 family DNA or RNA helicase
MGLGKTVQLIASILANPVGQTLVVVPKSVCTQWVEEISRFAPSLSVGIFNGDNMEWDVVITTYGKCVLRSTKNNPISKGDIKPTLLHGRMWGRIILDEAHEIRESKSKISKSCKRLAARVKWVVTGTPVFNTMKDFVNLGEFVGLSKDSILGHIDEVRAKYVLRRTKLDLESVNERLSLPKCDFENLSLKMNSHERSLYIKVFNDGQDHIREVMASAGNANMHMMSFLKCLLRIRQVMAYPQSYLNGDAKEMGEDTSVTWEHGSAKMDVLLSMIRSHPTEKTLIFCQFIAELDHIQNIIGQNTFRIDGSVSQQQRVYNINEFRKAPKGAVFLIQIKAGGVGLNLQEATRVYITSPSWNPATELQAIGRSHRTGQVNKVVVRKLIYESEENVFNSVEESMLSLQNAKSIITADVLDDSRIASQLPSMNKGGEISIRAIRNIFSV